MSSAKKEESERLREDLESATRAREALLAGIAHDLRNPLNTFAMSTGLLRDDLEREDVDAARALSLVKRMEKATLRMQQLIEDLVEGSRIEARTIDLTPRAEPVDAVLQDSADAVRPFLAERSASLEVVDAGAAGTITVDRARMVQAISKAVAFVMRTTGDGGKVTLTGERIGEVVEIGVLARSPGELPSSTPAPEEGRGGLALLIARGLVAAHGGQLELRLKSGTQLVFTLPTAK